MQREKRKIVVAVALCSAMLLASGAGGVRASSIKPQLSGQGTGRGHRAPVLGADLGFAEWPHPLINGWKERQEGELMAEAFRAAGLRSFRFLFGGLYSPRGPEATAAVKAENKLKNEYPWFPFDQYADYIAAHDFTTVVGVNVEEGGDVAYNVVQEFLRRGIQSKLVAIELSNEPHLNHRPWLPEEFAARAADVIERLTPTGVRFALPLTAGKEKNTPTKLSDNEWNSRMMRALAARVDLKNRSDIYGVLHLYGRGVDGDTIKTFNQAVRPFSPNMRYLITEFNIRSSLKDNPHLTNAYALEFARKLAGVMARPEVEAMYVHAVPYHSIMYWVNRRRQATVRGHRDPKLSDQDLSRGWHLTPAGRVYRLYSALAWNGEVLVYRESGDQSYWAVRADDGRIVVTLLNSGKGATRKKVAVNGQDLTLSAPPRSIVCFDLAGNRLEQISLQG